jgi:OOP family OmpA-OmpF porin
MGKNVVRALLLLGTVTLVAGCAGMRASQPPLSFTPHTFPSGEYTQKVNNVLFILDASNSMSWDNQRKLVTEKNIVSAIDQSIPPDLDFTVGLRTFGHAPEQSGKLTDLLYGMTKFSRSGLEDGLSRLRFAGGSSPMKQAIEAAGGDLAGAQGQSALIIVSDGLVNGAPAAAARLKAKMGDKLCIDTIAVGGDPVGEKTLQAVSAAGGCGVSTTASALTAPGELASFVEKVFLQKKTKPVAVVVPVVPAAPPRVVDSDGDGVPDSLDRCPDTPKGEIVDAHGCPITLTLHINFDTDKSDIKPEFAVDLGKAAEFIAKNQQVPYILITGYTDSVGTDTYNLKLSQRRADAVRQYLIDHFNIGPNRVVARGEGESNPVADNGTAAGRAENRRVEVTCCAVIPPAK